MKRREYISSQPYVGDYLRKKTTTQSLTTIQQVVNGKYANRR